jgi:deoxyribose-phosphate aldolase
MKNFYGNQNLAKFILPLIDHTNLNETATPAEIQELCKQVITAKNLIAAVCVYPQYIKLTKSLLPNSNVKIATVCNFPNGENSIATTVTEIKNALQLGADEIDVVFPYKQFLQNNQNYVADYLAQCRTACPTEIKLKVILETGVLIEKKLIIAAATLAIKNGADFIKTSTGKISQGASVPAVTAILSALAGQSRNVGIKISGGIKNLDDVKPYWDLLVTRQGADWITPQTVRFGSSKLLPEILNSK